MTEKTGLAAHLDERVQINALESTYKANVEATVKAELRYFGKVIDGDWSHIPVQTIEQPPMAQGGSAELPVYLSTGSGSSERSR